MNLDFLPTQIKGALLNCNLDNVYEIRLRTGFKIKVFYQDKYLYLTKCGTSLLDQGALICTQKDIDNIIKTVTEFSIYAHNDKIKNGFLTSNNGIRIGVAGECVYDNGKIVTIKNINSLNIRIPHNIIGCADNFINKIIDDCKVYNTLIVSPPMQGKTTILKDIANQLNKMNIGNILIVDERGEFANCIGENIDIISYSEKNFAFEFGIRALSPKIIITDELFGKNDWNCVYNASKNGVSVIASSHGYCLNDITEKDFYRKDIFNRIILLESNIVGKIKDIYYV